VALQGTWQRYVSSTYIDRINCGAFFNAGSDEVEEVDKEGNVVTSCSFTIRGFRRDELWTAVCSKLA
jgi:hypothetical protein